MKDYDFEEHLTLYKELYMSEGFDEDDAEKMAVHLMELCNIDVSQYHEQNKRL